MLTIRLDQLGVRPGDLVLDAGSGFGRHAFALARQGANVVALDYAPNEVESTRATFAAMAEAGEIAEERFVGGLQGDAVQLPFADGTFDRVITSEVLEHIQADTAAITEFVRVLKPGGTFAATVPTWLPEKINWMLSDEYHAPKSVGGHVRIYSATELKAKLRSAGLAITGSHHAHALHSPYWWLKCAVGRAARRSSTGQGVQAIARVGDRQPATLAQGRRTHCLSAAGQELHRVRPQRCPQRCPTKCPRE